MLQFKKSALLAGVLASLLLATSPMNGQTARETTTTGVVASSTANTLVVQTSNNQFVLFVYSDSAVKPAKIANGSTVSVTGVPGSDGVVVANQVNVISAATPKGAQETTYGAVPASVREIEGKIARQAKNFHAGVQAGVGLDPEVILVGVTSKIGPVFSKDLTFRPNADFVFGEVTKGVQINLDFAYRLPLSPRNGTWSAYLGAGPNLSFLGRNYERAQSGDNKISFSDFDFKGGLNVLGGIEYRSGMFFELKAGVYTEPTIRFMVGYRF